MFMLKTYIKINFFASVILASRTEHLFERCLGKESEFAESMVELVLKSCTTVLAFVGFPSASSFTLDKPWLYGASVFMLFYATAIAFSAPRIGLGNAIFFVLTGQLIAAATIDHFGLLGVIQTSLTPKRILGIAVMAVGLYLARKPV